MGCCHSSDESKDGAASANERTPLLDPNHSDHIQQIQGARSGPHYTQHNQRGDEQSEFSRILRQTAINVIDVTSTETHNLEQGELQDRATQYRYIVPVTIYGVTTCVLICQKRKHFVESAKRKISYNAHRFLAWRLPKDFVHK
ncbi:hypothetical protein BsWGS_17625 [Bradybaena similaris]